MTRPLGGMALRGAGLASTRWSAVLRRLSAALGCREVCCEFFDASRATIFDQYWLVSRAVRVVALRAIG